MNPGSYVSVSELLQAVDGGLLTKEEARTVLWAQFPILRENAAHTPPPIGAQTA